MSDLGRLMKAFRAIVAEFTASTKYHGIYEYKTVGSFDDKADLAPVRPETGMPALSGVTMRTGLAGAKAKADEGMSVGVMFMDGDPTRPFVATYGSPGDNVFSASLVTLTGSSETDPTEIAAPAGRVLRYGDSITSPLGGALVIAPAPVPQPVSRVKA